MQSKYIGSGQLAVMLTLFGIFYCVCCGNYYNSSAMLINIVSTAAILAVLIIPVVILASKGAGNIPETAVSRLGLSGRILSVLYAVFYIAAASDFLRLYSDFAYERYFREGSPGACIILLGIICIYIAWTGPESICRMSTVLLFMLGLTSVYFVISGINDIFNFENFSFEPVKINIKDEITKGFFPFMAAGAACVCILCGGTEKKTRKGTYIGLAAALAAAAAIVFACSTVLGGYITISEYPLLDAVIYVSKEISFQPDGVFFILWTVIAAAVISLLNACGGRAIKAVFPRIKGEGIIAASAALLAGILCFYFPNRICTDIYRNPVSAVVLIGVIPLILLIISSVKKEVKKS